MHQTQRVDLIIKNIILVVAITLITYDTYYYGHPTPKSNQLQENKQQKNPQQEVDEFGEQIQDFYDDDEFNEDKFIDDDQYFDVETQYVTIKLSNSYSGTFKKIKEAIVDEFPFVQVDMEPYPVDSTKAMISRVVTYTQWALMIVLIIGPDKVFGYIGQPVPSIMTTLKNGGIMTTIGLLLGGNYVSSYLLNTGAFEVYHDAVLIFSKLQSNKLPTENDLIYILANRLL